MLGSLTALVLLAALAASDHCLEDRATDSWTVEFQGTQWRTKKSLSIVWPTYPAALCPGMVSGKPTRLRHKAPTLRCPNGQKGVEKRIGAVLRWINRAWGFGICWRG
jgi:hypothetical protein